MLSYISRCLSVARECNSETYIVHKTNGSCVEQIVLLKQTLFVTFEGKQNFNIKRAITCMLRRFMHPWMACFLHSEDCQVVNQEMPFGKECTLYPYTHSHTLDCMLTTMFSHRVEQHYCQYVMMYTHEYTQDTCMNTHTLKRTYKLMLKKPESPPSTLNHNMCFSCEVSFQSFNNTWFHSFF